MKDESWRNEWPEAWERGLALGIPRPVIGKLVHRLPVKQVAEAMRAAEGKREPLAYVMGVLRERL
jgi:hypothetical protein